jgi:phage terminase Nu1 subunit (DNA packaging protein)
MLSAHELRQKLGVTTRRFTRLLKQGLPCKGKGRKRRFDPHEVAAWLRERGLARSTSAPAELPDQVVTTRDEAARLMQVSTRVFATWLTDPTFPGKAGTPGRRDGYFPIGAIRAWHLQTHGGDRRSGQTDAELAATRRLKSQIECDQAQVELEKELGTIGDTAKMEAFCRRVVAAVKSQLDELADRVNARLPAKFPAEVRKINRKVINESVADVLNTAAELVAGDQDDAEDLPDDNDAAAAV